jgi:hypothetical protein
VRNGARRSLPLLALGLAVTLSSLGCMQAQLRRRMAPASKEPGEVLQAAQQSITARYYQVKVYSTPTAKHLVALTPIRIEGNQPVRKKIDVWVFQENGYYMPKVFVRKYVDIAEPEEERGPIQGRFPIEVGGRPAAKDDWHPLFYDRTEEEELRTDILKRLNIPS